ncbi:hypothetical protein ACWCWD_04900 [Streptomyces sp. NPDC001493]
MLRLRIQLGCDRRVLVLTDTPRPNCPDCQGAGGHHYDYGDDSGEYAGTEWDPCPCWDQSRCWTVLRLPRVPRRRAADRDPWSTEPPF